MHTDAIEARNRIIIIIIISYLYRLNLFSNSVLLSIKDLFDRHFCILSHGDKLRIAGSCFWRQEF